MTPVAAWLVTGARGMLGRDVVARLRRTDADVVALDHAALDITDPAAVRQAVADHRPDVVVNCAAWTDVDGAEAQEPAALKINGEGPANLAAVCKPKGVRLVHFSTDYVFRGNASTPYAEDAPTDPLNAYGRTKLAGEQAVLAELPEHGFVLRTAWLYGANGGNFVRTMLRLERERDTVEVVTDQRGQPTWTADVAAQVIALLSAEAPAGIYHATSSGQTTWHDFTRTIYRLVGADPDRVRETTSAAFQRPAPRPAYSVLGHDRWTAAGLEPIRPWEDALREALPRLVAADQASERS